MRAIEILRITGESPSALTKAYLNRWNDKVAYFLLYRERGDLIERIERRTREMFKKGLINEVKSLIGMGCSKEHTSMQEMGYKEVLSMLNGTDDLAGALEKVVLRTRRYAKRQLTWWKKKLEVERILQQTHDVPLQISKEIVDKWSMKA